MGLPRPQQSPNPDFSYGHCSLFGPSVKVLRGGEAALDSLVLAESSFAFLGRSGGTVTDCLGLPEIQPDGSGVGRIDGGQPGRGQLLDSRTQPLRLRNHAWSGIHHVPHVFHLLHHSPPLAPVLSARSRQWSTGALAVLLSRTESRRRRSRRTSLTAWAMAWSVPRWPRGLPLRWWARTSSSCWSSAVLAAGGGRVRDRKRRGPATGTGGAAVRRATRREPNSLGASDPRSAPHWPATCAASAGRSWPPGPIPQCAPHQRVHGACHSRGPPGRGHARAGLAGSGPAVRRTGPCGGPGSLNSYDPRSAPRRQAPSTAAARLSRRRSRVVRRTSLHSDDDSFVHAG
jgi:hypothetical protein